MQTSMFGEVLMHLTFRLFDLIELTHLTGKKGKILQQFTLPH